MASLEQMFDSPLNTARDQDSTMSEDKSTSIETRKYRAVTFSFNCGANIHSHQHPIKNIYSLITAFFSSHCNFSKRSGFV
jgi:quercetin dioxygenase-like cupin family protein